MVLWVKKIYGVSYLGLVTAKVGESITEADFASDCYELSRNVIHVNNEEIRAGNIRLEQNLAVLDLCLQSQSVDTFKLSVNGSTAGVSYYFIGSKDDTLRFVSKAGQFTSQDCPEGSTQIFGIAFKGNFLALPGDKISAHRLLLMLLYWFSTRGFGGDSKPVSVCLSVCLCLSLSV